MSVKEVDPYHSMTKPVLKWVGGKTQILGNVIAKFPKEIDNYHEPFVGGGSVLLAFLDEVKAGNIKLKRRAYACDLNKDLIDFYTELKHWPDKLCADAKELFDEYAACTGETKIHKPTTKEEATTSKESYYYWVRSMKMTPARFLFLNKTCFRGLWREGPNGFNVPFGNYKRVKLDTDHLVTVSKMIQDVEFIHCGFETALSFSRGTDFSYFDPPYAPETKTSFVKYTKDGFDENTHERFFGICAKLETRFVLSNANVTMVREAFPETDYEVDVIECRRAINPKNPGATTTEVLISRKD
jgi:DNA adenine methylase